MNCDHCQELLSEYIDGELDVKQASNIESHLLMCVECAEVHEDFSEVLGFCAKDEFKEIEPPNAQAMWCRISNIIENEVKPEIAQKEIIEQQKQSWFNKIWQQNWSFSFTQIGSAVLGVALISSLLTIVAVKNFSNSADKFGNEASATPSLFDRFLGKVGIIETAKENREKRVKQQQIAIDYWNARVQQRRSQWKTHLREAFDRNVQEIDQVVFEYTRILEENPQDEVSGEMLDSAMNEKMELLREFSEL